MEKLKSLDAKRMVNLSSGEGFGFSFTDGEFIKMGYCHFLGGLL